MIQNQTLPREISRMARQLTVSYVRKRHQDPKTRRTRHYSRHPSLVLTGNWLEEAGFPTGAVVSVSIQQGLLILQAKQQGGDAGS
ncbi:MAG: SymE family type I addiction module toxin [Scandinavium sp.]|uniref:SymE family type I addiction module toxin n=1 Tax=Scandinavium sp. TaxID=2830653 RepID=UPI003F3240D4